MTTAAQVKKMVQPLLDRHIDLALIGRWIYVKPVHHFARAILIGRMAYAEEFEPQLAVIHLFEARKTFSLNWSEFLANERSRRRGLWFMSDPDVETSLIEAIEEQALPKLRAIQTLDDCLAFVARHMFGPKLFDWPQCKIIVDVALGDLETARAICKKTFNFGPIGRMTRISTKTARRSSGDCVSCARGLPPTTARASRSFSRNGRRTPSGTSRSNACGHRPRFLWSSRRDADPTLR